MELNVMIIDDDKAYLADVREYLDSLERFKVDTALFEDAEKKTLTDYDVVIINANHDSLSDDQRTVLMYPEYSVGRGYAKYSGKKALVDCIEKNFHKIFSVKDKPCIICINIIGSIEKGKMCISRIKKEIEDNERKIMLVDLSYSFHTGDPKNISSSDLMFYFTSETKEQESFLKNVLKAGKKSQYIEGFNSIREYIEFEESRLDEVMKGISGISGYEYIFIITEPGIRSSMYEYGKYSDLNVIIFEKDPSVISQILKIAPDDFKILPFSMSASEKEKGFDDKRVFGHFSRRPNPHFIRRVDTIFEQTDK
jgi:hypothetical protein